MGDLEREFGDIPLLVHSDLEVVDDVLDTIDSSFWHFDGINPSMNDFNRFLKLNINIENYIKRLFPESII